MLRSGCLVRCLPAASRCGPGSFGEANSPVDRHGPPVPGSDLVSLSMHSCRLLVRGVPLRWPPPCADSNCGRIRAGTVKHSGEAVTRRPGHVNPFDTSGYLFRNDLREPLFRTAVHAIVEVPHVQGLLLQAAPSCVLELTLRRIDWKGCGCSGNGGCPPNIPW